MPAREAIVTVFNAKQNASVVSHENGVNLIDAQVARDCFIVPDVTRHTTSITSTSDGGCAKIE